MRHIKFASLGDVERPFVRRYIQAAVEQAAPAGARGTGRSVVKTRSAAAKNPTARRKPAVPHRPPAPIDKPP
jgi:hypothetical protein